MTATTTSNPGWSSHRSLVALAVGYQWFHNGANFLAFKVAGNALHPLMVATLRFSLAALVVLPFALAALGYLTHPKTVLALECYLNHRIARDMGTD